MKNEDGTDELGFNSLDKAEKFVETMSMLSRLYRRNKTKFTMQFLADTMKKMSEAGLISVSDLYKYSEKEVMKMIESSSLENISDAFKTWKNADSINESDDMPEAGTYFVSIDNVKVRYINPLVKTQNGEVKRIVDISDKAKEAINVAKEYKTKKYVYLSIYTYVKNQMTIDDLMQDTYMKAIDNLKSYKIGTNFYAWISMIARNTAINYYNKNNLGCGIGSELFLSSNGDVSPCSISHYNNQFLLLNKGKIDEEIPEIIQHYEETIFDNIKCRDCKLKGFCNGGCIINRLNNGNFNEPNPYLCEQMKQIYQVYEKLENHYNLKDLQVKMNEEYIGNLDYCYNTGINIDMYSYFNLKD